MSVLRSLYLAAAAAGGKAAPPTQDSSGYGAPRIFTADFWTGWFQQESARVLQAAIHILFILVLFFVARFVLRRVINRAMGAVVRREEAAGRIGGAARARTIGGLLKSVVSYALVFVAAFAILLAIGVNVAAVVTTAGVLGLAVGFGAQKLVRDVISGFFILLENQYAVGDYVTIGTSTGVVEEIGMRTTWLRDDVGRLVVISNGDVSIVVNHSRGALLTSVEVGVTPGSDLDKVCAVLRRVGGDFAKEQPERVLSPFTCDGVTAMDGAKVTLRLVGQVKPEAQQQVQMDLRRRVRDALLKEGIQIA